MSDSRIGIESSSTSTSQASLSVKIQVAISDLQSGLLNWRAWGLLAFNDVKQRYRRSRVGQFWITIGMAVTMIGMGVVFGAILGRPIEQYLPFLGCGLIVWGFLSSMINSLANTFIASEHYLRSYPGSRSLMIFRTIARELIQLGHNLIIVPGLWLVSAPQSLWAIALVIPGLIFCILNGVWLGMIAGPLSARFRDLPQIIAQFVSLMFFFTPIMFHADDLRAHHPALTNYNPFHYFVEMLRAPLMGVEPDPIVWPVVVGITIAGFAVALPFYSRFRGRINYWI